MYSAQSSVLTKHGSIEEHQLVDRFDAPRVRSSVLTKHGSIEDRVRLKR